MATRPIYGKKKKTLKHILQSQESFEAESLYLASRTQVCSDDDPGMYFDFFYDKIKFASIQIFENQFLKMYQ